jgi:class 3 adenylate cyclase
MRFTLLASIPPVRYASRELDRHRGIEVDTEGDGLLATFDGPAAAIRCARAIPERRSRDRALSPGG